MPQYSEEILIEALSRFFKPHPRVSVGPGDDATLVTETIGREIVVSVDSQREGVHFNFDILDLKGVGHRALASALSDLAAMGAEPLTFLVDLEVSENFTPDQGRELYEGFYDLGRDFYISPSGGNVSVGSKLGLSITVVGEVPRDRGLKRQGAKEGDRVFVTGDLGRTLGGFKVLTNQDVASKVSDDSKSALREKFKRPWPRIKEVQAILRECTPSSLIDISDGLGKDLCHIATASEIEIHVQEEKLPIHAAVYELTKHINQSSWQICVASGEEYEIAFTLPEDQVERLNALELSVPITEIGEVKLGFKPAVVLHKRDGEHSNIHTMGFDHLLSRSGSSKG
jgi:thiamine-monophosphate kinase